MTRYILSPRAISDLDEIWEYTVAQWGVDRAQHYSRELQSHIEMAAANPKLGRSCDDIRAGYFKLVAGSHVIFYRLVRSKVTVVRILHQRMDFDRHL